MEVFAFSLGLCSVRRQSRSTKVSFQVSGIVGHMTSLLKTCFIIVQMDFQVKQGSLALSPFECPTLSPFSVLPACFEGTGELRSCSQRLILDGKKMMQLKTMPRAALVTWKIVWSKPIPGKMHTQPIWSCTLLYKGESACMF